MLSKLGDWSLSPSKGRKRTDMLNIEDTICAPATVPGTGAIAIIRMSGRDSFSIADKVIRCKGGNISDTEGYRLKYGVALEADGTDLDTVLVSVFRRIPTPERTPLRYPATPQSTLWKGSCNAWSIVVPASPVLENLPKGLL